MLTLLAVSVLFWVKAFMNQFIVRMTKNPLCSSALFTGNFIFLLVFFLISVVFSRIALSEGFPFDQGQGNSYEAGSPFQSDDTDLFLPHDRAFILSVISLSPNQIKASWQVADKYYLYKDFISFSFEGVAGNHVIGIDYPEGRIVNDPKYGEVEVFSGDVELILLLSNPVYSGDASINVIYRGCAEGGLCYPTIERDELVFFDYSEEKSTLVSDNGDKQGIVSGFSEVVEKDRISASLESGSYLWVALIFFLYGLVGSFMGCSYPLVPILSAVIIGAEDDDDNVSALKGFALSAVFVVFLALTFSIAGVVVSMGVNVTSAMQTPFVLGVFAVMFVLLSLSFFGVYEIRMPAFIAHKLSEIHQRQNGGAVISVAVMGVLSALIVGPCATPLLAGALIYMSQSDNMLMGWMALFFMGLGTGFPLLIVGAGIGAVLPKAGFWMDVIKRLMGFVMLLVAVYFLELGVVTSSRVALGLYGAIVVFAGVFLMTSFLRNSKNNKVLWGVSILCICIILLGGRLFIGSMYGGESFLNPFQKPYVSTFIKIKTQSELDDILINNNEKKIVMLDFSAEWCISCRKIEKNVFSSVGFKEETCDVITLEVDLTEINDEKKRLMERYGVMGPPTILFFDVNGNEISKYRVVGYLDNESFLARLKDIKMK